jgi:type IV pilus biogenesis protein CpaD/CtpE
MHPRCTARIVQTLAALAACATLVACASTASQTGEAYQGKAYRTGSNIPVHDGDLPPEGQVVKPDTVPIYKGPGPKVGPTGAGSG